MFQVTETEHKSKIPESILDGIWKKGFSDMLS